jgi:tRNA pseudouridine55 synthase
MTEPASPDLLEPQGQSFAPRPKKRDVHGWVVLDKPVGMTSTHAVAVVKRAFSAKKAGHAGTLDPLASGLLPIALGEATKTVPFVMDGRKAYQFTVAWGTQTDTDDAEGRVIATAETRPDEQAITALLPQFTGTISQVPPKFSAIKIAGERAYDLARDGEDVVLEARPVEIDALRIVSHSPETTTFEAECGKGTYVRAIARDLGVALGCLGHVVHLRRTRVGPFAIADAVSVETLRQSPESAAATLLPVKTALSLIPEVVVHKDAAMRLKRGQSVLLRGREVPIEGPAIYATSGGVLIAIGTVEQGELVPHRVFNL